MDQSENPTQENTAPVPAQIVITFPNGPHSTQMSCQYINVDNEQIGMAGRFLSRASDDMFHRAEAQQMQRQIIPANQLPPGLKI